MKKLINLGLALVLGLSLTACSSDDDDNQLDYVLDAEGFSAVVTPMSEEAFLTQAVGGWQLTETKVVPGDGSIVFGGAARIEITADELITYSNGGCEQYEYKYNAKNNSLYIEDEEAEDEDEDAEEEDDEDTDPFTVRRLQIISIVGNQMTAIETGSPYKLQVKYTKVSAATLQKWHEKYLLEE